MILLIIPCQRTLKGVYEYAVPFVPSTFNLFLIFIKPLTKPSPCNFEKIYTLLYTLCCCLSTKDAIAKLLDHTISHHSYDILISCQEKRVLYMPSTVLSKPSPTPQPMRAPPHITSCTGRIHTS